MNQRIDLLVGLTRTLDLFVDFAERGLRFVDLVGYLRGRYELPLQEVPTVVRELTVNITRHWLYARRPEGKDDLPPAVVRAYKAAMDMLTAIQKGSLTIGVASTQVAQPEPSKMRVKRSGARRFGPDLLNRY